VRHSERFRQANDAAELLARFAVALHRCTSCPHPEPEHTVITHITDALNGWPLARSFEPDRTNTTPPVTVPAVPADQAAHHLRDIDKRIRRIHTDVETVVKIVACYVPHTAGAKHRRETARFKEPGCASCARLPSPAEPKQPRYEPPHTKAKTDCGGLLERPILLCWWCARWVRDTGRLPTPHELARHHRGDHVPRPIMATRPGA